MAPGKSSNPDRYAKPELVKHISLKEITFECPDWQCSVTVPPPPA
ncbi:MAG: hypothetical protein ACYC5A_10995 [Thermoleophilia bacterium]